VVDLYVAASMGDGVIHVGIMPAAGFPASRMSQAESNARRGVSAIQR
jgi:hypothetical protein